MAVAPGPIRIPNLQQSNPIVDREGRMTTEFARRLNDVLGQIVTLLNAIGAIPEIQSQLSQLDNATQAALDAAALAQAAADGAAATTDATKREQALVNSYIEPDSVLTASPTLITIAPHTRMYADGTSASVNGGTVIATGSGDTDYVSYVDPERDGGTVTYVVSTTPPVQTGDTHVVGAVLVPAAGTSDGGSGPRRPGYVEAKFQNADEA